MEFLINLEGSRLGGTREKPGALKVAITNGFKNNKNTRS
jgi:hypothetical protein